MIQPTLLKEEWCHNQIRNYDDHVENSVIHVSLAKEVVPAPIESRFGLIEGGSAEEGSPAEEGIPAAALAVPASSQVPPALPYTDMTMAECPHRCL